MSRAFVKEADEDSAAAELPERPLSDHPNYVSPRGHEMLQVRVRELLESRDRLKAEDDPMAKQRLAEVKRDLRYYQAQLERAQVVDPAGQPHHEVHFGATVIILDEDGKRQVFHIVGDDEADVASHRISWATPLARAILGAKIGDTVKWQRPAGSTEIEIVAISYNAGGAGRKA